jgi:hypothetical protein
MPLLRFAARPVSYKMRIGGVLDINCFDVGFVRFLASGVLVKISN